MKANEVNEIINNICEKIGIGINSAKEFVPMFAKYNILHSAFLTLVFLIITVIGIVILKKLIKSYKDADMYSKDSYVVASTFAGIASLITGIITLFNLFRMIEWIIIPEAMAIQYIVNMMKQ